MNAPKTSSSRVSDDPAEVLVSGRGVDNSVSSSSRLSDASSTSRLSSDHGSTWIEKDVREAFLKSLVPQASSQSGASLASNQSSAVLVNPEGQRPEVKVCNFSLEGLLEFKCDHVEHTAHKMTPKALPARPNYDNRKRKFMAIQREERKKQLCFDLTYFCIFCCGLGAGVCLIGPACMKHLSHHFNGQSLSRVQRQLRRCSCSSGKLLQEIYSWKLDALSNTVLVALQNASRCLCFYTHASAIILDDLWFPFTV